MSRTRRKFIHYGHSLDIRMSPADIIRFMRFVRVDKHGCWIFCGSQDANGYASFKLNGRRHWASRVSYATFKGRIRAGNDVHHTQRYKSTSCVNPDHLLQRSREWNSRDGGLRSGIAHTHTHTHTHTGTSCATGCAG